MNYANIFSNQPGRLSSWKGWMGVLVWTIMSSARLYGQCSPDMTAPQIDFTAALPLPGPYTCAQLAAGIPAGPILPYADACDPSAFGFVAPVDNLGGLTACGGGTILRTWTTLPDASGNVGVFTQMITVTGDNAAPVFTPAAGAMDVTISCSNLAAINAAATTAPTATDACGNGAMVTSFSDNTVAGTCTGNAVRTVVWRAQDVCGNSSFYTVTITIQDTTPPVWNGVSPVLLAAACTDDLQALILANVPTATDDCSSATITRLSDQTLPGNCPGNYTLLGRFMAQDDCGNTTIGDTFFVSINVSDFIAPTGSNLSDATILAGPGACPVPTPVMDITIGSDESADPSFTINGVTFAGPSGVNYSDNCTPDNEMRIVVQNIDMSAAGTDLGATCPVRFVVITWRVEDRCGNSGAFISQQIEIRDMEKPKFMMFPDNVILYLDNNCYADTDPDNTGMPLISDNCDNAPALNYTDASNPGSCTYNEDIIRTWTVTDDCGNVRIRTQVISLRDTLPPNFNEAPTALNTTCNCFDAPCIAAAQALAPTASNDNCSFSPVLSVKNAGIYVPDPTCPFGGTYTNTWTLTDLCGNVRTYTQVITIDDNAAPVIDAGSMPILGPFTCNQLPIPAGSPLPASDQCDASITMTAPPTDDYTNVNPCSGGTIKRRWQVVDACGNINQVQQMIPVLPDNQGPVIVTPAADITVECGDTDILTTLNSWITNRGGATATDNCTAANAITWTATPIDTTSLCGNTKRIRYQFTPVDACNQPSAAPAIASFWIYDNTAPVLSQMPIDATINCAAMLFSAPLITANDACQGSVTVNYNQNVYPNTCPNNFMVYRTWTATDGCGNSSIHTQAITVMDNSAPILMGVPASTTVACNAIPAPAVPTVSDNCDISINISYDETSSGSACSQVLIRTWTATDLCGNNTSAVQTITVVDNIPPVITGAPSDMTVNCNAVPAPATPTASDNCDMNVPVIYSQQVNNTGCQPVYTRTWTATDDCSNVTTKVQIITVIDNTPPVLAGVPADMTVACDAIPSIANPTASDICDNNVAITFAQVYTPGDCDQIIYRTWTATDDCGNTAVSTQTIVVNQYALPYITNQGPGIQDPCTCIGNGRFSEQVAIISFTGETWTIGATTLINPMTLAPFLPGTPIPETPAGSGQYIITGQHLDGIGYTLTAVSPQYPGNGLTIQNRCYYADPEITAPTGGPFCLGTPPITLTGIETHGAAGTATFKINGNPATTFNAAALGLGTHTVMMTFDAGGVSVGDSVTCVTSTMLNVQVVATPSSMNCNDNVNLSLPATCEVLITPDMIMEGDVPCEDDYTVQIIVNGTNTGNIITAANIGQTLTVKVIHQISGNFCWGSITVEDYLAPQLTCPADVTIECNESPNPYLNPLVGLPLVTDCSAFDTTYVDNITNYACAGPWAARIIRTWTATDANGLTSSCNQTIFVDRSTLADVTFPPDYDGMPGHPAMLDCSNPNTTIANTGSPMLNGLPIAPNGYCMIDYTYSDQIVPICAASYKILRKWTVYNWCAPLQTGVNPILHTQIIKVMDTTPPVVTCGPNITISTSAASCSANYILPPVAVVDNCSGSANITVTTQTPNGTINGNGGPVTGLPIGSHVITYFATDGCGNVGSCSRIITVQDLVSPTPVCIEVTTVTLNSGGIAIEFAESFNNGSHDNCCLHPSQPFRVKRMGQSDAAYGGSVTFTCADAGDTIPVILRVRDCHDNYNTCMIMTIVEDKTNPDIFCPDDLTIDCEAIPANYNVFGNATTIDNCSSSITLVTTNTNINNCGEGVITRTFTATDASGLTARCTQRIYVENQDPFDIDNITWPLDTIFTDCGANATDVDSLPAPYNEPILDNEVCGDISVDSTDQIFTTEFGICFKILRHWTVIDWCQYTLGDPDSVGIWVHTQIIKVNDITDPILTVPADITFHSQEIDCIDAMVNVPLATASDCNPNVIITNDFNGGGANASGVYPFGTTEVVFTANDGCGNSVHESVFVTVIDGKKPSIVCHSNSANLVEMSPGVGMAILNPEFFMQSISDNCTDSVDLLLSFSANVLDVTRVFTCDSLGIRTIRIWATDEEGNADFCQTTVLIQDNAGACTPLAVAAVSGAIQTEEGEGVNQVEVTLVNDMGFDLQQTTNIAGGYDIGSVPVSNDYLVTPNLNTDPDNGVTTYDLVLMSRHILGIQPLGSPYKIIAADINRSGSITAYDMVLLRQMILHVIEEFPNNSSWRFVDNSYVFPNPTNPFTEDFPEVYAIQPLNADMDVNFVAIKTGDVNGSADPGILGAAEDRQGDKTWNMYLPDLALQPGQQIRIPVKAQEGAKGFQFTFHFDKDKLDFENVLPAELTSFGDQHFSARFAGEGMITFSWNDKTEEVREGMTMFYLVFTAKTTGELHTATGVDSRLTRAEAYDKNGEIMNIGLQFTGESGQTATTPFELYQNFPNPFDRQTVISFHLPSAQAGKLQIFDLSGRLVYTKAGDFSSGYNNVRISREDLPQSGIYYYQLETTDHTAVKKMILE